MTNQEIIYLGRKAKGWTHYAGVYLKHHRDSTWLIWSDEHATWQMLKKSGINHYDNIRNRDDIETIAYSREILGREL